MSHTTSTDASDEATILGIDLGTTNSEVAAWVEGRGRVEVLGPGGNKVLPSCVGLAADGTLLVGEPARNQALLAPGRTLRSFKREMGSATKLRLGERTLSPQEASALVLRTLVDWAEAQLGHRPERAVITVPAYFSDAQRLATREAGELAGLEVVRILNEPTAASLAYGHGEGPPRTLLVYDLGGGTFDVSIVRIEGEVTEVLASHGDNRLGGDDFDRALAERLANEFEKQHGIDLRKDHDLAWSRLCWAAERAKRTLSYEPYASIREDNLAQRAGTPLHLDCELSREQYEQLIDPLLERTLESVHRAIQDSGVKVAALDGILLVGGAARTPAIAQLLRERTGIEPSRSVHPDLCVALGAGVLASRLEGRDVERILVDISPYSFGPSFLGELDGEPYEYCYRPIIERNTPLPVTRTESYYTTLPRQECVDIEIYQGDDPDALKNIPVGRFRIEGLMRVEEPNEILCRMNLDLDGILRVSAIEKRTGKSKQITIEQALRRHTDAEIARARERIAALHGTRGEQDAEFVAAHDLDLDTPALEHFTVSADVVSDTEGSAASGAVAGDPTWSSEVARALELMERSQRLLTEMHDDDREEAIEAHACIHEAIEQRDSAELERAASALRELLFFVEGR